MALPLGVGQIVALVRVDGQAEAALDLAQVVPHLRACMHACMRGRGMGIVNRWACMTRLWMATPACMRGLMAEASIMMAAAGVVIEIMGGNAA